MNSKRTSLRKSAFVRLLVITIAAVLMIYGIGVVIGSTGIQNVRTELVNQANADAIYMAGELNGDITTLGFFCRELCNDKSLMKYTLLYEAMSPYQRLVLITDLFDKGYEIRRFSQLAGDIKIMLPLQAKCITAGRDVVDKLDPVEWNDLLSRSRLGTTSIVELDNELWLTLPRFERNSPLVMIALEISTSRLYERLVDIANERTDAILLLREDGTPLLGTEQGLKLYADMSAGQKDEDLITAKADVSELGMTLIFYRQIDKQMMPFVRYRITLWILTLAAMGLLTAYLIYYRNYILRPVDDMLETIISTAVAGQNRLSPHGKSDFDDIYVEFNHMIEHIEDLTSRVYEEQIRAQQAELKQLQLQIDPHFLYNSLYLIYRIARSDGNASIAELSSNLSSYYRYITKMPEHIVMLKDEIEHVMNYMRIQEFRFRPRIRIEAEELPEEIAEEPIPSLVIQPLVENAFLHGVKDMSSGGVVSIRYTVLPDEFHVIVADNSGRMTQERAAQLWQSLQQPDGT